MDKDDPNSGGNSRKCMEISVRESLKRLQTDYIDILYAHIWDYSTSIEDLLYSFDCIVKSGKVLNIGISDAPAWVVSAIQTTAKFKNLPIFCCYQGRYSLCDRGIEQSVIQMCKSYDIGLVPWGVLGQGKLTGKYTKENKDTPLPDGTMRKGIKCTEKDYKIIDKIIEIAKKKKRTPSQIAMRWVLNQKQVASVLLGVRTLKHLESNLQVLEFDLSEEEMKDLTEVSKGSPDFIFPHDICQTHVSEMGCMGFLGNSYEITKKF